MRHLRRPPESPFSPGPGALGGRRHAGTVDHDEWSPVVSLRPRQNSVPNAGLSAQSDEAVCKSVVAGAVAPGHVPPGRTPSGSARWMPFKHARPSSPGARPAPFVRKKAAGNDRPFLVGQLVLGASESSVVGEEIESITRRGPDQIRLHGFGGQSLGRTSYRN